jgi:hypothetical protein
LGGGLLSNLMRRLATRTAFLLVVADVYNATPNPGMDFENCPLFAQGLRDREEAEKEI